MSLLREKLDAHQLRYGQQPLVSGRVNYLWLCATRLNHAARILSTGTAASTSTILGLLSLSVPLWLWVAELNLFSRGQLLAMLAFGTAGLVGATTLFVAFRSLFRLPPTDYAAITVGGKSATEILNFTSYEIWKITRNFGCLESVRQLEQLSSKLSSLGSLDSPAAHQFVRDERRHIQLLIGYIRSFVRNNEKTVQRIISMKRLAAKQLELPIRRICDYVFQFSPFIFENRLRKLMANWFEVLSIYDEGRVPVELRSRLEELLAENKRIVRQIKKRHAYQTQLLTHAELHEWLRDIASSSSTSDSLRDYAAAVAKVGHDGLVMVRSRAGSANDVEKKCLETLLYLLFKQRAHPGFDLHRACIRLAELQGGDDARTVTKVLRRIEQYRQVRMEPGEERTQSEAPLLGVDDLAALAQLDFTVNKTVERSRQQIAKNFASIYREWVGCIESANPSTALLVTHGYSKTVRETIRRCPEIGGVFIMDTLKDPGLDTRLLELEIKEHSDAENEIEIGSGDEQLLVQLVDERTYVLVLIGAECFDAQGRVVHPRVTGARLERLKATLNAGMAPHVVPRCVVAVVGESYKKFPSILDQSLFLGRSLRDVFVYGRDLVDFVVTDQERDPVLGLPPWRARK